MNKENWAQIIDYVKKQCTKAVTSLILKFERWFLAQELLNATGIIYHQY